MSDTTIKESETPTGQAEDAKPATFNQDDVDRLLAKVRGEERRKAAEKYHDYDDLKAKASESATIEERVAAMEQRAKEAELSAMRANIANEYGISVEDRDLFLTGGDEDSLRSQAKRLQQRDAERKAVGNHVPSVGYTPDVGSPDLDTVRRLFGKG